MNRSSSDLASDLESHAIVIMRMLNDAGFETRMVGGAVRDALLGLEISDIDLATTALPDRVTQILALRGIKVVPTGLEHGTVTAVVEGKGFEITTLREDIKTDGRRAVVTFTTDWQKDAARRDFTMNALSRDGDGKIYDYFGGFEDAKAGRIRFVGKADDRIKEDYLRLLRYFRFYAWFSKTEADAETLAACTAAAPNLKQLSRERVWREVKKLLAAPDPSESWMLMMKHGIVPHILPQADNLKTLCNLVSYERARRAGKAVNPLLRLTALLHDRDCDVVSLKERFALSQDETQKLAQFSKNPLGFAGKMDMTTLSFALHRYGLDLTEEFLVLNLAVGAQFNWDSARPVLEKWQPKTFPLNGEDVLALGLIPGPRVGEILHAVEKWWVAQDFVPDHAACVEYAKSLI